MFILKVATFFLVALAVGAEKKIELQDIEEDNLRSEMRTEDEKEIDKSDSPQTSGSDTGPGFSSLDFMKSGLLRYFDNSQPSTPQEPRYVHQYAVTEPPERNAPSTNKVQYGPPQSQQAMVGYLSNIPMQIYLVPQYNNEQSNQQHPGAARMPAYQTAPEAVQTQNNYIEVPQFMPGKVYVHHYAPPAPPAPFFTYPTQPTASSPQATVPSVVGYPLPIFHYNPSSSSTATPKDYYPNLDYTDTNSVDEISEQEQKQYNTQTGAPAPESPRHYYSRMPIREEYRHNSIPELPQPHPLLLRPAPSHLAHLPKTLPIYRPLTKPVYQGSGFVNSFTSRPHEHYGAPPLKKRPTSLLDSYIPSSLQLEYLKRGLIKEPQAAYDALANARYHQLPPRHYERGFLPNQMYHTGAGGVTYGRHYKRTPKVDKITQKP